MCIVTHTALAQDAEEQAALELAMSEEAEKLKVAGAPSVRRFHEVLNELLAEFGYDIKTGDLKALKNLAIRKVRVSEAIPNTYQNYIGMLIAEQIKANTKVNLIQCIQCQVKSSTLVDGKIKISSPETNVAHLRHIAEQLGIDHFIDVMLIYHTTHMVLAFQAFEVDTGKMVWARTYNSETIRSRFQKLAVDYSQVAKSRPGEEYQPDYRYLVGFGGAGLPNVAGNTQDNSMLSLHFRATEKFDNRKNEFGLMLNMFQTLSALTKEYPTTKPTGENTEQTEETQQEENSTTETVVIEQAQPEPFKSALGIYGIYTRNFLGSIESYNSVRHGMSVAVGALLASGYVAGKFRVGWEIYLGKTFVASIGLDYIAPSEILVDEETVETKGGAGADATIAFNL